MTTQFISLLVIIAVLVIDFVVNGRKKTVDETQKRIEGNEGLKKFNFTEYLLLRKKNVVVFILFTVILKPLIHFSFFTEKKEIVNFDKKIYLDQTLRPVFDKSGKNVRKSIDVDGKFAVFEEIQDVSLEDAYKYNQASEGVYTKNGEQITREVVGVMKKNFGIGTDLLRDVPVYNYFYYPYENLPISFNKHLELMFKSKLWIFLVSLGTMGIIVFLFNDKIKVR
tara:strand:- start:529 stop:1200 length:672 start_codon:yes stop_codon:yes gene_type:complete